MQHPGGRSRGVGVDPFGVNDHCGDHCPQHHVPQSSTREHFTRVFAPLLVSGAGDAPARAVASHGQSLSFLGQDGAVTRLRWRPGGGWVEGDHHHRNWTSPARLCSTTWSHMSSSPRQRLPLVSGDLRIDALLAAGSLQQAQLACSGVRLMPRWTEDQRFRMVPRPCWRDSSKRLPTARTTRMCSRCFWRLPDGSVPGRRFGTPSIRTTW